MKTALILVDLQNDYFPGGKMELVGSVGASQRAARLLAFFREAHMPLVHIQHVSTRPTATFFLPDTVGVQTHANVQPLEGETVYQKHFPNSFRETPLLAHLQREQIERVVIAGMMTHMCVDATVRAAFDFGYQCLVAEDACATRALMHAGQTVRAEDVQRAFLAALDGTYGKVLAVDDIIAEMKT
ncbi:MAG TPA: cysteine hydrolase family protein [Verrucomicrobiae bacterium]